MSLLMSNVLLCSTSQYSEHVFDFSARRRPSRPTPATPRASRAAGCRARKWRAAVDESARGGRGFRPRHRGPPCASAALAEHEHVLARMRDLAVRAVGGLEEVHPRPVQLVAAAAERLRERLRRAVARREQVPVRLAGRGGERRYVALEAQLERIAEQLADARLVA